MVRIDRDEGVATIFVCLTVGLLILVLAIGLRLGGAVLARQKAETAADLGALAGAARMLLGTSAACATATDLVVANGAQLMSCRAEGLDLLVEVSVPVPAFGDHATARARAGPVAVP